VKFTLTFDRFRSAKKLNLIWTPADWNFLCTD